jgi:hypothetical protein
MPDNDKIQLPKGFTLDESLDTDIKLPSGFTLDEDVKKKTNLHVQDIRLHHYHLKINLI